MTPRKPNTLFPGIALELELSEEVVEDIVRFYWKEVQKQLNEPEHLNIQLDALGTFEMRIGTLEYTIEKYKGLIKHAKLNTYNKHALYHETVKKLERLEKMLELYNIQKQKKQEVRLKQKNGKTV